MGVPTISLEPFTVEEFLEFTDGRPDDEKWELIDGLPEMNAAPSGLHQRIVGNVMFALMSALRALDSSLIAYPGIGVRVSANKLPIPDVMVSPRGGDMQARDCKDAVAVVEVLSPSTRDKDLKWKHFAYAQVAAVEHYMVIAQDTVEVIVFDRATGFAERRITDAAASLDLPACGVVIPLAEIYRDTGLL